MRTTLALTVCVGIAASAHAQVFEMVIHTPPNDGANYALSTPIEYSLYLDNSQGPGFSSFFGWSSFAGFVSAPGTHFGPVEGALDTSGGAWVGRRPPSTAGFPGGSAGGFRFSPQTYTPIPNGLAGTSAGMAFEGLAASTPLGGFLQDPSPRLEVFRAAFVADSAGTHTLGFNAVDAAFFNTASYNTTQIGVQSFMNSVGASYTVTPTPGSLALLGLAGLATRRRR